jgi:hypothetical protein
MMKVKVPFVAVIWASVWLAGQTLARQRQEAPIRGMSDVTPTVNLLGTRSRALLPEESYPITKPGPTGEGVEWLQYYVQRATTTRSRLGFQTIPEPSEVDLTGARQTYLQLLPKNGNDHREFVIALMEAARSRYRNDPSKVCRHHAILVHRLCQKAGVAAVYRFAWRDDAWNGHSFNQVTIDVGGRTTRWVVDAYNGIAYRYEDDPNVPVPGEASRILRP